MRRVKIGICGLGTVGAGVFNVISRNIDAINARANCQISISQVGCRRDNRDCDLTNSNISRDIFDVAKNPDVDIVVDDSGDTSPADIDDATANVGGGDTSDTILPTTPSSSDNPSEESDAPSTNNLNNITSPPPTDQQ